MFPQTYFDHHAKFGYCFSHVLCIKEEVLQSFQCRLETRCLDNVVDSKSPSVSTADEWRMTPKERTHRRNTFLDNLSGNPHLSIHGELWVKMKNENEKSTRVQLHSTPPCSSHHSLPVGSDGGRNQTRQISDESVQGSQNHTGQIWPFTTDLAHHPYNSVCANMRHCDVNRRITLHHNHTGDIPRQYLALSGCSNHTGDIPRQYLALSGCTLVSWAARLQCSLP